MALEVIIERPLDELQRRLDAATAAGADLSDAPADFGLKRDLQAALAGTTLGGTWAQVPLLTAQSFHSGALKNHTLVRFRGMVQDMCEPEYYAVISSGSASKAHYSLFVIAILNLRLE